MSSNKKISHTKQKAVQYLNQGNFEAAFKVLSKICTKDNNDRQTWSLLTTACIHSKRYPQAEKSLKRELKIDPSSLEALMNLGGVYYLTGRLDQSIECCQRAIQYHPSCNQAHYNLGKNLAETGKTQQAIEAYRRAVQIKPDFEDALVNLAVALRKTLQYDESIIITKKALQINPNNVSALASLGALHRNSGDLGAAISCYRKVIKLEPNLALAHSPLLFTLNNHPNYSAKQITEEHINWGSRYSRLIKKPFTYANARDPKRKLRIGYLSPDFKQHSVAYYIEALLANHHRDDFEIFAYANVSAPDEITKKLQAICENWCFINTMDDKAVARKINDDGIDILVDLAGHTAGSRLTVLAWRPAPIQINYLGYPNTTGLPEVDYRITDNYADPRGMTESYHSEQLIRLKNSFLCYTPPDTAPKICNPPVFQNGYITFGSFNSIAKLSDSTIDLWSKILISIDGSRLKLKSKVFKSETVKQTFLSKFILRGVSAQQIQLIGYIEGTQGHLQVYNDIDIALDTMPYNGTTTTCESLWMGVPVITLAGTHHVARVGVSLLSQLDLTDWIADDNNSYLAIAIDAADNIQELKRLRANLRQRMKASVLCDATDFCAQIETKYRDIWRNLCNS